MLCLQPGPTSNRMRGPLPALQQCVVRIAHRVVWGTHAGGDPRCCSPLPAALTLTTVLLWRAAAGPDQRALPCLAAVPLSEDHKPNRIDERQRIESAGGVVVWAGTWRVGGVLAVSRAFGDRLLKRYVVAMPDITEQVRPARQLVPGSWATH